MAERPREAVAARSEAVARRSAEARRAAREPVPRPAELGSASRVRLPSAARPAVGGSADGFGGRTDVTPSSSTGATAARIDESARCAAGASVLGAMDRFRLAPADSIAGCAPGASPSCALVRTSARSEAGVLGVPPSERCSSTAPPTTTPAAVVTTAAFTAAPPSSGFAHPRSCSSSRAMFRPANGRPDADIAFANDFRARKRSACVAGSLRCRSFAISFDATPCHSRSTSARRWVSGMRRQGRAYVVHEADLPAVGLRETDAVEIELRCVLRMPATRPTLRVADVARRSS